MSPAEDNKATLRDATLEAVTRHFVESLQALGIQTFLIAYALSEDPQGQGLSKVAGNSTLILNLIASIIKGLTPEDFKRLQIVMQSSSYFAESRGDKPKQQEPESNPDWVN
jgi:hypothetical protein